MRNQILIAASINIKALLPVLLLARMPYITSNLTAITILIRRQRMKIIS